MDNKKHSFLDILRYAEYKKLWIIGVCILIMIPMVIADNEWAGSWLYKYQKDGLGGSTDNPQRFQIIDDLLYYASYDDDEIGIFNISNPTSWVLLSNHSASSGAYSVDGVTNVQVNGNWLFSTCFNDDTLVVYDISNKSVITPIGSWIASAPPCSVDGMYEFKVENRSGSVLIHVIGRTDDDYGILNATNPSNITCLDTFTATANPCSVDDSRSLAIDPLRSLTYVSSIADNTISIFNTSNPSDIVCLYNITRNERPYSIDGIRSIEWIDVGTYNYIAISSFDDSEISVFNVTIPTSINGIARYYSYSTTPNTNCSVVNPREFVVADDGKTIYTSPYSAGMVNGVIALNFSGLGSRNATCLGWLDNRTSPNYLINDTTGFGVSNNLLFISVLRMDGIGAFIVVNGTNLYPTLPPSNTCSCPVPAANWFINSPDHCNITAACDITGFNLTITNGTTADKVTINATVTAANYFHNYTGYTHIGSLGYLKMLLS